MGWIKNITIGMLVAGTTALGSMSCTLPPLRDAYENDFRSLTDNVTQEILDATVKIDLGFTLERDPRIFFGDVFGLNPNERIFKLSVNNAEQLYFLGYNNLTLTSSCTGVVLRNSQDNQHYVLSAAHCQPEQDEYNGIKIVESFMSVNGMALTPTIVHSHTDLALFKLDGNLPYLKSKIARDSVKIGDTIVGAGFPEGVFKALFTGRYTAQHEVKDGQYLVIDAHAFHGNSGSPILVLKNDVSFLIGIHQVVYDMNGLIGISPLKNLQEIIAESCLAEYLQKE